MPKATGTVDDLKMMILASVACLLLIPRVCAQTGEIAPSPLIGVEGNNLTVDCTLVGGGRADFELTVDGTDVTTLAKFVSAVVTSTGTRFVYGPLERSDAGKVFLCDDGEGNRASATLAVQWPPTVNSGESITLQVGDSYPSVSINFTEGNPRSSMTITGPSQPGNPRVSISSDGVVNINGVSRDDAGTHTATWRNDAGSATFTLDLDVNGGGPKGLSAGAIAAMVVCSLVFMALGN